MRLAVYPGSFDPITNGHLDIIERASVLFDYLVVAVFQNAGKKALFPLKERVAMLQESTQHLANVRVDSSHGLLSEYVKSVGADVILRALRAASDFDYEFQLALMNRKLDPDVETMFMMATGEWSFLSSSIVKEVASFGGCVKGLVPYCVERRLDQIFGRS
ncbi:MAG: pantetheine-phosphate adenylyltransferase [Bacillota bacterium]